MTTLIIATRNAHKTQEIQAVLGEAFSYHTLRDLPDAPAVVEDAPDFAGNAAKKALQLSKWIASHPGRLLGNGESAAGCDFYTLADDSGLEVDALHGAPGVHSARFAALDTSADGNSPDADNNAKLLRLLAGIPPADRTARFRCVIALAPLLPARAEAASPVCYADEAELSIQTFEGACEGRIANAGRGNQGFGYDPLFIPDGFEQSFAELGEDVKNQISHRARALRQLQKFLRRE